MAKNNVIFGLDVGTAKVRAIVASIKGGKEETKPRIIGVGWQLLCGIQPR